MKEKSSIIRKYKKNIKIRKKKNKIKKEPSSTILSDGISLLIPALILSFISIFFICQ